MKTYISSSKAVPFALRVLCLSGVKLDLLYVSFVVVTFRYRKYLVLIYMASDVMRYK